MESKTEENIITGPIFKWEVEIYTEKIEDYDKVRGPPCI